MHVSQHVLHAMVESAGDWWGAQSCQQQVVTGRCACQVSSPLPFLANKLVVKAFSCQLFTIQHAEWNACQQAPQTRGGEIRSNQSWCHDF